MLLGIALHGALSFVEFPWVVQDSRQHTGFGLFFFSVHGFRMPVFFLLSGFFTAMLWRRRGLKSLVWQRVRRVFLPCMLGLVTIVPAVNWISGKAIQSAIQQNSKSTATRDADSDIWTAARIGSTSAIKRHLENGADINAKDGKFGVTPLCWAALLGQTEAVDLLIRNGADVNAGNKDGGRPLHAAAFLGHTETVDLLIQEGADVNARNKKGETPLDSLTAHWRVTQFVAALLRIEIDEEEVKSGRPKTAELLRQHGAGADQRLKGEGEKENANGNAEKDEGLRGLVMLLMYIPVFHHLWFLWFLCWLVIAFTAFASVADGLQWKGPPKWLVLSPARFLWLIPLTMVPQSFMGYRSFGPDTSIGLLPAPQILGYYAVFFGFGALYFDCNDDTGRVGRWWWLTLPIGLLIIFPLALEFSLGSFEFRDNVADPSMHRPISVALQTIYVWTMTFALMGLFRKLLTQESRTFRYLADSSYWLYLAHLPLIMVAQLAVRDWQLPAIVKFGLVCVVVSGFLLLTYQTLVRYTWLGTLLNGPRRRPEKAASQTAA